MRTHPAICPLTSIACLVTFASVVHAAPLTSWTLFGTSTQLDTASPTVGSGTQVIYASAPTSYTLSVGDSITLSGGVNFVDVSPTANTADQFRFGLYDSNGQSGTKNWLGYFASNAGTSGGPTYSRLWERDNPSTNANFYQGLEATTIANANATPSNLAFASGNYTFSLTYTRTATGLDIAWTLIGTDVTYSVSKVFSDLTPQTFTFDRVGLAALTMGTSQVNYSNLDLTYTAVPEPAVLSLLVAAGALILVRRRKITFAA